MALVGEQTNTTPHCSIPLKAIHRIDNVSRDIVCGYIKSIEKKTKLSVPIMIVHLVSLFLYLGEFFPNIKIELILVDDDKKQYKIFEELLLVLQSKSYWNKEIIECFDSTFIQFLWNKLILYYKQHFGQHYISTLLNTLCELQKNQGNMILSRHKPSPLLWSILNRYTNNKIIQNCILLILSRMIPYDRDVQLFLHKIQQDQNINVHGSFLNMTKVITNNFDECGLTTVDSICNLIKYISQNHDNTMRISSFTSTLAIITSIINILYVNNIHEIIYRNILLNILHIIQTITGGYPTRTYTLITYLRDANVLQIYLALTVTATSSLLRYESIQWIYHIISHQPEPNRTQIITHLLAAGVLDHIIAAITQHEVTYDEVANTYYFYQLREDPDFECRENLKQTEYATVLSILRTLLQSKQVNQINDTVLTILSQALQNTDPVHSNVGLALICIEELLNQALFRSSVIIYKVNDVIESSLSKFDTSNRSLATKILYKISNKQ